MVSSHCVPRCISQPCQSQTPCQKIHLFKIQLHVAGVVKIYRIYRKASAVPTVTHKEQVTLRQAQCGSSSMRCSQELRGPNAEKTDWQFESRSKTLVLPDEEWVLTYLHGHIRS